MDWLTKQKTYAFLILFLIVVNVSILIILWMGRPKPPEHFSQKPPNNEMFLRKELGLSDEQDKLLKQNRKLMLDSSRVLDEILWNKKRELQAEAFKEKVDSAKVNILLNEITLLRSKMESMMFKHFSDLKAILTKEQLEKFKRLLDETRKPGPRPEMENKRMPPPPPPGEILPLTH
ncbi:MAG: periplasmic heavy metal sensor [Ignavibacteriaceae bacterium]|nr:periplasmic heavy metal sensor [Ignavibacteriaceae bacterium]